MSNLKIVHTKRCFLLANLAEPTPPLGTILGNLGVNTIMFCQEFNTITKNLPTYLYLKVYIFIYENRTFYFKIKLPSTSFFLNLLKYEKKLKTKHFDRIHEKTIICIKLKDLIQLALFKFPFMNINKSFLLIWGTAKSMNIHIIS